MTAMDTEATSDRILTGVKPQQKYIDRLHNVLTTHNRATVALANCIRPIHLNDQQVDLVTLVGKLSRLALNRHVKALSFTWQPASK